MAFSNALWELLYATKLDPQEEQQYQAWAQALAKARGMNPDTMNYDYDMRGYWQKYRNNFTGDKKTGHFTDEFKKPNHPTFSTQSKYSSNETPGGLWEAINGQWQYTPSDLVKKMQGDNFLRWYFDNYEKGSKLNSR